MKYLWTTIHVNNMEESINFYSDLLGLKVLQRFPAGPGVEIAFMGNGIDHETQVELYVNCNNAAVSISETISVGFAVDCMEAMLDTVKSKNISLYNEPIETPKFKWFTIKDPNGLCVQFFQQKSN